MHPQITASCFILEAYDPPLESTFSPQSILAQDTTPHWSATEVIIIGGHEFSGRLATLCAPAEFNDSGIKSFTVQLHPDNHKITVETANLVPRLVARFDHERTELTETNGVQRRPIPSMYQNRHWGTCWAMRTGYQFYSRYEGIGSCSRFRRGI
jgi:hypothetical protein